MAYTSVTCETCGGEAFAMGSLGLLMWFRCSDCGTEFYIDLNEVPA